VLEGDLLLGLQFEGLGDFLDAGCLRFAFPTRQCFFENSLLFYSYTTTENIS
jgi:hypothetical protein